MSDKTRRDRCNELQEEWRRPRLPSATLTETDVRQQTRALLEHCLQAGCRAERLEASAAYRSMDDFVRALLEEGPSPSARVRLGLPGDDNIVADHYLAVWRSYGTPEDHFGPDARERTLRFLKTARDTFEGGCILAEANGGVVGSVGYQVQVALFPEVLRPEIRKVGYIWTVYVDPPLRGRGVATLMLERAITALRAIGCTTAILHASDAGAPVYAKLGFKPGPEMRLRLPRELH